MFDPDDLDIEFVKSSTRKMQFKCGNVYRILDEYQGRPFRVFLKKGHTGVCVQALLEAVGRLLTIIMQRTDLNIERVWKTLIGITCESGSPLVSGTSCIDALARELKSKYPFRDADDGMEEPCAPTD